MSRRTRTIFLLPLMLLAGCAFTDVNMTLPETTVDSAASRGADRSIWIAVPFEDGREQKARCGMQKNGYNMDTADALCDRDPQQWLAERLSKNLELAGFHVVEATPGQADARGVVVEGELLQFFVEPVIGMWTGSLEADIHVRLTVRFSDGLVAERRFFSKGVRSGVMMSVTPNFESAVARGSQDLISNMVLAIVEIIDAREGVLQ